MLFLHNIVNSVWMIEPGFASNYLPLVTDYISGKRVETVSRSSADEREVTDRNGILSAILKNGTYSISEYGRYDSPEDAPDNSIAVINVTDAITKHDQDCGPAGMLTKSNLLKRCYNNSRIRAIALVIDSGGGEGYAMRLMAETIESRNKPVGAFIDDFACSAAYGIASGCDFIIANSKMARIGSIGTYMTIADFTEHYKQRGIALTEIYATASTDKNNDYYEAIKGNLEPIRNVCNQFNEDFLQRIETNRKNNLTEDRKSWGTGKVYFAEEAQRLGLIDGIDTFDNFINYFNT